MPSWIDDPLRRKLYFLSQTGGLWFLSGALLGAGVTARTSDLAWGLVGASLVVAPIAYFVAWRLQKQIAEMAHDVRAGH